ncbi:MAG: UDP-N-acetylmuramoyl-L-alanine--D-glutamate ligase [Eggerthellaceae bacterium]|nr:UDP-N-acetylmuramoyl-L-alanine--D-glutamate ligase [Eggerthellaceae bacterium]
MENGSINTLLPNTKGAARHLGHVLLLGLGVTGQAVGDYCMPLLNSRIDSFTIILGSAEEGYAVLSAHGDVRDRASYAALEDIDGHFDLCIASPGISQFSDLYQAALGWSDELISEVEFAWRESAAQSKWVAITGTNGKTTTTALCAHILQEAHVRAAAVGNIGDTCITAVAAGKTDIYVAEVSSYQLASTKDFAPDAAVLLNITPDHLAWHKSFEAYADAKAKVFANLRACDESYVVLDASNEYARQFVRQLRDEGRCMYVPVGTSDGLESDMRAKCGSANAAFVREDKMLVVALNGTEYELVSTDDLQIVGEHNVSNALVAASVALCLGTPLEHVRHALKSFTALEHRLEPCGEIAGVACFNDSKATNPEASIVALHAFANRKPIVLLGGDDKGTSLDELVRCAEQSCKAAICFGAAGPRFFEAFEGSTLEHQLASKLEAALDAARALAKPGDTILLSPACASFDEFDNFEHRGQVFKQLVEARQA